ncbi:Glycosyl hydrolases family 32 N-terminal domain-containing protein [Paenibacillus tianmuensis]|uniref:Glycosyl hydrolases family 32 N-terminal domain-containing protein n=1 Tax=Paenibacillus tianmuensis TaxID=624147 RepID=A0A1G4TVT7_9BACL|nr:hypothetical protein [Paenibacillus tianmuensis]SCW85490.1 Glycosyl hydrolases family 32 N-terminal domain-containing protein [Paenibacillus tianmuensis]
MKFFKSGFYLIALAFFILVSFQIGGYLQDKENRTKTISGKTNIEDTSDSRKKTASNNFTLEKLSHIPNNAPLKIEKKYDAPVLSRGKSGEWDSVDLLNPSVIKKGNTYYNYYSGYDGNVWRTGLATSADGINWSKYDKNPVLDISTDSWDSTYIAANGAAIEFNGKILYLYHGKPKDGPPAIGLAQSEDGFSFKKHNVPVLTAGDKHSWDSNGVADPYVIEHNGMLYMYFLGMDEMQVQRLGIARSEDGIKWEKIGKPIMDVGPKGSFDENGLGEPSVIYYAPYFYMLYTGRAADEKRDIGVAISLDGVNWKKLNYNGLFNDRKIDTWDGSVICDTTILLENESGLLNVWYGGGNKPEPAQNLNGDVGLFKMNIKQNREMSFFDPNNFSTKDINSKDLLKGSYEIDVDQEKKYVWVSKEASISLQKTQDKNHGLIIKGYVPFSMHKKSKEDLASLDIAILLNGKELHVEKFNEDRSFEINLDESKIKDVTGKSDFVNIEIKSSNEFVPAKVGQGNDNRGLSFILNYVGLH